MVIWSHFCHKQRGFVAEITKAWDSVVLFDYSWDNQLKITRQLRFSHECQPMTGQDYILDLVLQERIVILLHNLSCIFSPLVSLRKVRQISPFFYSFSSLFLSPHLTSLSLSFLLFLSLLFPFWSPALFSSLNKTPHINSVCMACLCLTLHETPWSCQGPPCAYHNTICPVLEIEPRALHMLIKCSFHKVCLHIEFPCLVLHLLYTNAALDAKNVIYSTNLRIECL